MITLTVPKTLLFVLANHLAGHFAVVAALTPRIKVPDVATYIGAIGDIYWPHLNIAEVVVHKSGLVVSRDHRAQHRSLAFSRTAAHGTITPATSLPLVLEIVNGRGHGAGVFRVVAGIQ